MNEHDEDDEKYEDLASAIGTLVIIILIGTWLIYLFTTGAK